MNAPTERAPIPEGPVSTIRGRWQVPAITWVVRVMLALGVSSAVLPGAYGTAAATAAVAILISVPLLRIAWLVFRWGQESDRRFVLSGIGLLGVVVTGAVLAALGIGG